MGEVDLFGMESDDSGESMRLPSRAPLVLEPSPRVRGKHYVEPRGYAAMPGTGPEGKTCRDCAHYARVGTGSGKVFPKCRLARAKWTCGRGSDILARAPACKLFENGGPGS